MPQALPPTRLGLKQTGRSRLGQPVAAPRGRSRGRSGQRGESAGLGRPSEGLSFDGGPLNLTMSGGAVSHSLAAPSKELCGADVSGHRPPAPTQADGAGSGSARHPPVGPGFLGESSPAQARDVVTAGLPGWGLQRRPEPSSCSRPRSRGAQAPRRAGRHTCVEGPPVTPRARLRARMWASLPGAAPAGAELRAGVPGPRGKEWKGGSGALTKQADSRSAKFFRKGAPLGAEGREEPQGVGPLLRNGRCLPAALTAHGAQDHADPSP